MLRDGRQGTGDEIEGELLELDGLSAADGRGVGGCVPGGSGGEPVLRGDGGGGEGGRSRYYGETEELLGKYAWYVGNSKERTWPVGRKKPNDLGLFDLHGHVWNWCQEGYQAYPQTKDGEASEDKEDAL